jgi:hypothetical protein
LAVEFSTLMNKELNWIMRRRRRRRRGVGWERSTHYWKANVNYIVEGRSLQVRDPESRLHWKLRVCTDRAIIAGNIATSDVSRRLFKCCGNSATSPEYPGAWHQRVLLVSLYPTPNGKHRSVCTSQWIQKQQPLH